MIVGCPGVPRHDDAPQAMGDDVVGGSAGTKRKLSAEMAKTRSQKRARTEAAAKLKPTMPTGIVTRSASSSSNASASSAVVVVLEPQPVCGLCRTVSLVYPAIPSDDRY